LNIKTLKPFTNPRLLVTLLMGFSSGLPFLLIGQTLKGYLTRSGIDLATIGFFSLVQIPYTFKFVWSPIMDRYTPLPLGRRRGWLLIAQVCLGLSLFGLSFVNPKTDLPLLAVACLLVAFFSSSQDIVVDAYRREILADEELGLGASSYLIGYRFATMFAGAGSLYLADHMSWTQVYWVMAATMGVGILTTLLAPEPLIETPLPKTFREAVLGPLSEFFRRDGALWILGFVFFYKFGEQIANSMYTTFYMKIGFTNTEIASVAKVFAVWAMLTGGFVGGALLIRLKIYKSLWLFGILQTCGLLVYAALASAGHSLPMLAAAVAAEYFTSGMATTAFIAFMSMQSSKQYSATQLALLSSLMQLPTILFASQSGNMANALGWNGYFIACALMTIPGLLLLFRIKKFVQV
jgi:MFS transporter, PAT family, beta-lactamase induction signal transducer AmpG